MGCRRVCTDARKFKTLRNGEDQEFIGKKDANDEEDGGYYRNDEWRASVCRAVESTGLGFGLGREELFAAHMIHLLDIVANIGGKANPN